MTLTTAAYFFQKNNKNLLKILKLVIESLIPRQKLVAAVMFIKPDLLAASMKLTNYRNTDEVSLLLYTVPDSSKIYW